MTGDWRSPGLANSRAVEAGLGQNAKAQEEAAAGLTRATVTFTMEPAGADAPP